MNKLFQHICASKKKLELFQVQLVRATLAHFTCLAARKMEFPDLDSTNYAASDQKLHHEFTSRFPEFRRDEVRAKLFVHPFNLAVEDSPDDCKMELIELQADMDTKREYSENRQVEFHKLHVCGMFSNLSRHARKIISLFGSSYCCEQFLQKMKLTKTRCGSQLTDEHFSYGWLPHLSKLI